MLNEDNGPDENVALDYPNTEGPDENVPTDYTAPARTDAPVHVVSYSQKWRAENMKSQHKVPCGSIVEVDVDMDNGWGPYAIEKHDGREISIGIVGKIRMYVVSHDRDCDGTPLYAVASSAVARPSGVLENLKYRGIIRFYMDGIGEENLRVINLPPVKLSS